MIAKFPNFGFWSIHILAVFGLNLNFFRFRDYAIFRDYVIVRNQNFSYNNINPISWISDQIQNKLLASLPLNQISTLYFVLIFTVGYFLTFVSLQKLVILFQANQSQLNQAQMLAAESKTLILKKFIVTIATILLTLLFCYNAFILERFLMGQERIFWAYFLVLPYIYHLLKYITAVEKLAPPTKIYLVLIPILIALSNIHVMILSTIIAFSFGLFMFKKCGQLILFSILNVILIGLSLVLNYDLLNAQNSNFYLNNIAANSVQNQQIVAAFSAQVLTGQNLATRVLIGSASWNSSTFFEADQIQNDLQNWAYFSIYFNQNLASIYLIFIIFSCFLGLYYLFKSQFKYLFTPVLLLLAASLVLSFGYSFEPFTAFNRFWLQLPGGYIFREPGKLYALFLVLSTLLLGLNISQLNWQINLARQSPLKSNILNRLELTNVGSYLYLSVLGLVVIANLIPFFALSSSLNYIQLPKIIDYALNNCQGKTMAVFPNDTYITPFYSKTFIVNPFTASQSQNCNIIRPNKVDLIQSGGQTIKLDISGQNLLLNSALETYRANLPTQTQNTVTFDAQKQDLNAENLTNNLKNLNIDLLLVDYSSIDYGFNLQSDLNQKTKLIQKDGYFELYQI